MVIDTFNASHRGRQAMALGRCWLVICLFGAMGISDLLFFIANSLKIPEGGWLPLVHRRLRLYRAWTPGGAAAACIWKKCAAESLPLSLFLERADKSTTRVAGLGVFLSSRTDIVPGALLHNLKHNKVLHERVVIVNVVVEDTPLVPPAKRLEVEKLGKGFYTVRVHHGFFETPDVPQALEEARRFGLALDVDTATFFIGRETLVPAEHSELGTLAQLALSQPWPATRCRRRASITCRPTGWSNWAPRSRSDGAVIETRRQSPASGAPGPDPRRAGRGVRRYRHQPALRHARIRAGGGRPCRQPRRRLWRAVADLLGAGDRGDRQICRLHHARRQQWRRRGDGAGGAGAPRARAARRPRPPSASPP